MKTVRIILIIILIVIHGQSLARKLDNSSELFTNISLTKNQTREIRGSYLSLANTHFTNELDVYKYKKRLIKIINTDNLENIKFEVSIDPKRYIKKKLKATHFPRWNKSTPEILKELDFSKVNGKEDKYNLAKGYVLTLLQSNQDYDKTYILEKLDATYEPTVICIVQVLLPRNFQESKQLKSIERNRDKIENIIQSAKWSLTIKPYGILKNDNDHFLVFLEYGKNTKQTLSAQPLDKNLKQIDKLIKNINKMHAKGYVHGDLTLDNMLTKRGRIKIYSWSHLQKVDKLTVGDYLYLGSNPSP